jgi:hypothetical protein
MPNAFTKAAGIRPVSMSRNYIFILVAGLLAGCATGSRTDVPVTRLPPNSPPPPFCTADRLTKQQLDWYIQKAVAWLQADHGELLGMIYGSAIDHSRPIECSQSDDGRTVTVKIPQEINPDHEASMILHLDTQTGEVKSRESQEIFKSIGPFEPANALPRPATAEPASAK